MADSLSRLMRIAIALKDGDREFALFFHPAHLANWKTGEVAPDQWHAEIGNPCESVSLGEAPAEFEGHGATAEEAVNDLIDNLLAGKRAE